MGRKTLDERKKICVTLSVDPLHWEQLDERCKEMQTWLLSKGVEERQAKSFTRSALVRESIRLACSRQYFEFLKLQIGITFGVNDDQIEMF